MVSEPGNRVRSKGNNHKHRPHPACAHCHDHHRPPPAPVATLAEVRERAEREHIRTVLRQVDDCAGAAAERLGIARSTLYDKMRRFGMVGYDRPIIR
jgi:DNA-binding NtrC family response regulator